MMADELAEFKTTHLEKMRGPTPKQTFLHFLNYLWDSTILKVESAKFHKTATQA
jgi:hypothetical protein